MARADCVLRRGVPYHRDGLGEHTPSPVGSLSLMRSPYASLFDLAAEWQVLMVFVVALRVRAGRIRR